MLIEIMLIAQTNDKRVNKVNKVLFKRYPTIKDLANANISDLEQIIKELGSYKKKSVYIKEIASKLLNDGNKVVPNDREYLESLSGVGRKTTNVFLSVIYNESAIAVDTHVERVSKRLNLANKNDSVIQVEKKLMKKIPKERWSRTHNQLVLFGRYYCKARNPECSSCKLKDICKKTDH